MTLLNFDAELSKRSSIDLETLRLLKQNADTLKFSDLNLLLFGHAAFQYLHAGCELGLFELLSKEPNLSKEEIGERLKLDQQPTRCLLFGLTALRLILKVENAYRNSFVVETFFADGNWEEFHDVVLFEARIVEPGQLDFVESLRQNQNVGLRQIPGQGQDLYHRLAENPELEKIFYRYMSSWSRLSNPLLLKQVDFSNFRNVVDISGGDGTNAIALASAYPNLQVTLLDIPATCQIAQNKIDEHGLADRVQAREADIFVDDLPTDQDCFLFIHALVIWTLEENTSLLHRAYEALRPGGCVVIFNSMSSDEENGPVMSALDTAYFVSIPAEGGMIYTWNDHEECLRKAGFTQIERLHCDSWTPHGIIVATKQNG